jgi:TatD DNase family protein
MLIDTHAHLTNPQLLHNLDDVLQRATQAGLTGILCVGTTLQDSQQAIELAERFPEIRAAVGIHPNYCADASDNDWQQIVHLSQNPAVVALGETGLDRYWDDCPWEVQLEFFRRHIRLARETDLPVVIHMRDCSAEMLDFLEQEQRFGCFRGVLHSFTGSSEMAAKCVQLGLYISFAGMLTFKNSADLRAVAATVPLDRLLVETDSPYLTPHPYRGQRPNRPDLVTHTLAALAEAQKTPPERMAQQTTQNAMALFSRWQTALQPV